MGTSIARADVQIVGAANPLRLGGWLLVAGFLSFVLAVAFMVVFDAAYQSDIVAAAEATDTTMMTIPASEQARVAAEHFSFVGLLAFVLLLIPFAVLLGAFRTIRGAFDDPAVEKLTQRAWRLGIAMTAFWCFFALLSLGLYLGPDRLPPLVAQIDVLGVPVVTASAMSGCAAVIFLALSARRSGVAPRVAAASGIVAGLLIVIGVVTVIASRFTMDLPPIAPFVPALILGIGVVRSARRL